MSDIYFVDEEEESRNAAKAGLMLAKARYDAKYAKFVRKSASRLSYIEDELTVIARECAAQVNADPTKVEAYLRNAISDELAVTDPEQADVVNDGSERGELHVNNVDEVEPAEDQHDLDIKDPNGVATEIENQDARSDLNDDTGKFGGIVRAYASAEIGNAGDVSTWKSCYRCAKPLNPVIASVSPVCTVCKIVLTAEYPDPEDVPEDPDAGEESDITDDDTPMDEGASQRGTKALEIVSLENGQVVEEIPLIHSDPNYVAQVTLGLYTQMDRDKFFIREVEVPTPKNLDIGEDEQEYEINPLVEPVPPLKTPETAPAEPEREPVRTHVKEAANGECPNDECAKYGELIRGCSEDAKCKTCDSKLRIVSDDEPWKTQRDAAQVIDPNAQARCEMCSFTGTVPQVQLHETQTHPELAQKAQQMQQLNATPGIAPAALPGQTPAYSNAKVTSALSIATALAFSLTLNPGSVFVGYPAIYRKLTEGAFFPKPASPAEQQIISLAESYSRQEITLDEFEQKLEQAFHEAPAGYGVLPPDQAGLPRPGSAFKLVARFDNLQDLHEWEKHAGRGN